MTASANLLSNNGVDGLITQPGRNVVDPWKRPSVSDRETDSPR
jgi:hypothetical protein